ncbi:helix-turn-helix domain-containing protein [Actinotalea sp. BY-33]|uniref:Helix-turn-helix domain-containing protein n=1 Tax=Actinotalea soli TaxID=2819234 RepID=A0A939LT65_9CELL|nr:helix-turn-helix transcriptional regulator [Actinotalea soli]MBO1751654.1 helix-turn-helix domain-containing protein [Actinotalea soli]
MTLGEFLQALRARLDPGALGLPRGGRRRVAGLRREEVAVLAGVSVDYYTRLEQGRERRPSAQVVEALARGLDLAEDERQHLFHLSGYAPPVGAPAHHVRPELARQLDRWPDQAAFVLDGTLEILAANALARALLSPLTASDNLARAVFQDPAGRTFYRDWEGAAHSTVAALRHNATRVPAAVLEPFVAELAASSEEFRALWAQQHVRGKSHAAKRLRHPVVGDLSLTYEALDVPGAPGQQVIIYDAEPGTPTAEAMALLRLHAETTV